MKKKIIFILLAFFVCLPFLYHFSNLKSKSRKDRAHTDLTIIGQVKMTDSIGRQPVEVIKALREDLNIGFIPTDVFDMTNVPKNINKLLHKEKKIAPVVLFEEVLGYPDIAYYKKVFNLPSEKHIKIAYSMVESTKIPEAWASILNTYFDAVAVPDEFLVDVYKNSGVNIPIYVVPLTIDLSPLLSQEIKSKINTPFVFANFSCCEKRKNQLLLVRAFAKAFGDQRDVILRINYRSGNPDTIAKLKKEVTKLGLSNIEFMYMEESNSQDYIANFSNIDCYVSLSKGEGFAIQPREAMAAGIPVIVTNNTAQSILCKSGLVRSVDSNIPESADFFDGESAGDFFNCRLDDAKEALLDVYYNYDKYLKSAEAARKWAEQYSSTSLRALYLSLIKPKTVVFGENNVVTPDYLETNSKELYEKYQRLIP